MTGPKTEGVVYAMVDPRTGERRYVGLTTLDLRHRLSSAVSHARRRATACYHKDAWIRTLLDEGLRPSMVVLERVEVGSPAELQPALCAAEVRWIAKARLEGWPLTNIRPGGEGPSGEEARALLSKLHARGPLPPEVRKKISESNKVWKRTPEHLEALQAGRRGSKNTPEHNEKIAASKRGKPLSEAHKQKIREAHMRRKTRLEVI